MKVHFQKMIVHVVLNQVHGIAGIFAKQQVAFFIDAERKHKKEKNEQAEVFAQNGKMDARIYLFRSGAVNFRRLRYLVWYPLQSCIDQNRAKPGIFPYEQ